MKCFGVNNLGLILSPQIVQFVSSNRADRLLMACNPSPQIVRVSSSRAVCLLKPCRRAARMVLLDRIDGITGCKINYLCLIYKLGANLSHRRKTSSVYTAMPRLGKKGVNPGGTLSTQEVARVLGVSHPTLLKLMKTKRIPEPQVRGRVRYWSSSDVRHARVVLDEMSAKGEIRLARGAHG
jgi:excisionase family DNA binding protein